MIDRELLELAAKAADARWDDEVSAFYVPGRPEVWNPLTDDGDRYRLLSRLRACVDFESQMILINNVCVRWPEDEPDEARAIVRAAAKIGRSA